MAHLVDRSTFCTLEGPARGYGQVVHNYASGKKDELVLSKSCEQDDRHLLKAFDTKDLACAIYQLLQAADD